MYIVFKSVYIHFFFFFVLDSFLCSIRKYGEERPMCICKDMDHMLIMVCPAGHMLIMVCPAGHMLIMVCPACH